MAIFKAYNLIRVVIAAHLLIGYLLITAPRRLAGQSTVLILGEAVGLQQPRSSFYQNPLASGIAGLLLILLGLSDFLAVSGSEETARGYWGDQAPVRCLFFAGITMYTYAMKPGRGNVGATSDNPVVNSVIFSWAFFEAIWWFWIYTNLREERASAMARIVQRRKQQQELELAMGS